jgi:1-acyl-sn-glycerol-3-phosphate acyltransferase
MSLASYKVMRLVVRFVWFHAIRQTLLHERRVDRSDGFILACTHIGHLEPLVISVAMRRQVHWMARKEFYRHGLPAALLKTSGAFQIDRYGSSITGIRTAAQLAEEGRCIGIFPEGGVVRDSQSVIHGGPIKGGICTIAIQAMVPVVPVVILGTEQLTRVKSWLPFRRTPLHIAFGSDIFPPTNGGSRRSRRLEMVHAVEGEFQRVYADLVDRVEMSDLTGADTLQRSSPESMP